MRLLDNLVVFNFTFSTFFFVLSSYFLFLCSVSTCYVLSLLLQIITQEVKVVQILFGCKHF